MIVAQASAPPAAISAAAPCSATQLDVQLDPQPGRFTGMMHDGVEISVRDVSEVPCRIAGRPELTFLDARGTTLAVGRGVPPHMHPGPVVPERTLDPGASLAAHATWIVGDVFDHSLCLHVAAVRVSTGVASRSVPLTTTICGPAGGATYATSYFTAAFDPLPNAALPVPGAYVSEGPDGSILRYEPHGAPHAILSLAARDARTLRFTLAVTNGPPAYDNGRIEGTIPRATTASFRLTTGASAPCDLHFAFYDGRAVVTQRGACGFGNGVDASGRYLFDATQAPVTLDERDEAR